MVRTAGLTWLQGGLQGFSQQPPQFNAWKLPVQGGGLCPTLHCTMRLFCFTRAFPPPGQAFWPSWAPETPCPGRGGSVPQRLGRPALARPGVKRLHFLGAFVERQEGGE